MEHELRWSARELRSELNRYEEELRAAGRARNTINTYVQHPERFINWLEGPRLSCLCGCVFPGEADGVEFFACRLFGARCLKSGGDDDPAEQGGHVAGGRLGLGCVPR